MLFAVQAALPPELRKPIRVWRNRARRAWTRIRRRSAAQPCHRGPIRVAGVDTSLVITSADDAEVAWAMDRLHTGDRRFDAICVVLGDPIRARACLPSAARRLLITFVQAGGRVRDGYVELPANTPGPLNPHTLADAVRRALVRRGPAIRRVALIADGDPDPSVRRVALSTLAVHANAHPALCEVALRRRSDPDPAVAALAGLTVGHRPTMERALATARLPRSLQRRVVARLAAA